MAELCQQFALHPNQISDRKKLLLENAATIFCGAVGQENPVGLVPLHAQIGPLALESNF